MELLDPRGRKIDYIRISITRECNLKCIYCAPGGARPCSTPKPRLAREQILRFIKVALPFGLRKIRLTGGEPLLREDLCRIISDIKKLGIPDLSLTTNGILLKDMAPLLRSAGLDRVNISLDSLDPAVYRKISGGGELETVFQGINAAHEAGFEPLKINMVPVKGINAREVLSFAMLTIENPVHIRFIELMPLRKGHWGKDGMESGEILRTISVLGKITFMEKNGSSTNYKLEGAKGIIGFISPMSNHFCESCNRLRLTAEGKLRPCLFSEKELDISGISSEKELEKVLFEAVKSKPYGKGEKGRVPIDRMSEIGG